MGNFRPDNKGFGRSRPSGGFSGGGFNRGGFRDRESGFRGRDSGRRPEMHDVICDKCKKECQVPFKPSGDKPVLCSDCFRASGGGSSRNSGSSSGISPEQFNQLNAKLDKIIEILNDLEMAPEDEEDVIEEAEEEPKSSL